MAASTFGEFNFGGADFGDRRLRRRLVRTADRILQHPGGSLPDKLQSPAALKGLYRLVAQQRVTHAAVLGPHQERVQQRIAAADGDVLIVHDSTELDYTGLASLSAELGLLGGKGRHRGYLCHQSLAVAVRSREVLGLTSQILYSRRNVPQNEPRGTARARPQRESRLWRQGCEASPRPSARQRVIDVSDRGSDLFEFLAFEHAAGRQYVVRSTHNRECEALGPAGRISARLHEYARGLDPQGHFELKVAARDARVARTARLRIASAPLWIAAPRQPRGEHDSTPLTAWVVCVREEEPPTGASPVEWILLTNVEVGTLKDARERVTWYELRWTIEELHKAQKSGCSIEQQQFTETSRLESVIALLSVVAVELLRLRNAARDPQRQNMPAAELFPEMYVRVLSAWRYGACRPLAAREFYLALARLGGHQNRKHDHPPGWLILWRGWTKLENMVAGAAAIQTASCGQT